VVDTAEIGIHLTAGSENIEIYGNSFINNPTQVKYVSNKLQEWSKNGQGNYWSNYLGWDMDNNGIGDAIFEPNDGIDKLVWQYPEMKMLMDSPAILMLRWVQKQFPVLKPPGVKDSYPLMQVPVALKESTQVNTQKATQKVLEVVTHAVSKDSEQQSTNAPLIRQYESQEVL
jgi:nitrous oxidase accessory protein